MPRQVEERIAVAAPLAPVWGLLVEPRSWTRWWPAVRFARTADFKPLREGSRLEVVLELGRLVSTLRPRVEMCAEGRTLAWRGHWLGVPCRHQWFLEETGSGVRVAGRTAWPAAGGALLHLGRLDRRWQRGLVEALRGLKRVAEQMA